MKSSDITIIIRTVGRPTLINSIDSACREFENVIVVADACDIDVEKFKEYDVKFLKTGRKYDTYGSTAINMGAFSAETEYIALLDDDDEFVVNAGMVMQNKIKQRPEIDIWIPAIKYNNGEIVCSNGDANDLRVGTVAVPTYKTNIFWENPFMASTNNNQEESIIDFNHVKKCLDLGKTIDWYREVLYLIRPKLSGYHGGGQREIKEDDVQDNLINRNNFNDVCKRIDQLVVVNEKIDLGEHHSDLYDFNMSMIDIDGTLNIAFRSCNTIRFDRISHGDWSFINTGKIINNKLSDIEKVYFHGMGIPRSLYYDGMEDPRLFVWNKQRWMLFVRPNLTISTIKLILLNLDTKESIFLEDPLNRPFNKNWMPYVDKNDQLFLITDISPFLVYKLVDKKMEKVEIFDPLPESPYDLHGSSNVININNKLIGLIHSRVDKKVAQDKFLYWHAFCSWDEDWSNMKIGVPFIFEEPGIEFCTSILERNENILMSYSIADQGMNILCVPKEEFGKLL